MNKKPSTNGSKISSNIKHKIIYAQVLTLIMMLPKSSLMQPVVFRNKISGDRLHVSVDFRSHIPVYVSRFYISISTNHYLLFFSVFPEEANLSKVILMYVFK